MRGALAATLVAIALGSPARAEEPDYSQYAADARPHVKAAIAAYTASDYVTSVREWEAAYAIDRNPQLLYSWAQAERLAKRCGVAIQHYRKYLEFKLSDTQIAAARGGIAMCVETIDKSGCDPVATAAAPATVLPWYEDPAGGAVVAGVVGVGVGIGFLFAASSSRDRASHAMFSDDHDALLDEATGRRRIGITALTLGAALGGFGVALFVHRRSSATLHVDASANTAMVTLGGAL